ncbi:MAG: hypothetical protein IK990_09430, partial [Ruminiclostridium sp.]|nr:hypothetical protein [Ruminiclostridium sp.]
DEMSLTSRNVSVVPMRRRCIGTTSESLFYRLSGNNCQKAVIEDTFIITSNNTNVKHNHCGNQITG